MWHRDQWDEQKFQCKLNLLALYSGENTGSGQCLFVQTSSPEKQVHMLQPSINSSPSSAENKQHELNKELTIAGDHVEKWYYKAVCNLGFIEFCSWQVKRALTNQREDFWVHATFPAFLLVTRLPAFAISCVFLLQVNKLTSVFFCVYPLIDDILMRHNIVKVTVEPRAAGEWFRGKLWQCYNEIYLQ